MKKLIFYITIILILISFNCKSVNPDNSDDDTPDKGIPIYLISGFNSTAEEEVYADSNGIYQISATQQNLIQIILTKDPVTSCRGHIIFNGNNRPLPLGSTLNSDTATFNWIPPIGFLGDFFIQFTVELQNGTTLNISVNIKVSSDS